MPLSMGIAENDRTNPATICCAPSVTNSTASAPMVASRVKTELCAPVTGSIWAPYESPPVRSASWPAVSTAVSIKPCRKPSMSPKPTCIAAVIMYVVTSSGTVAVGINGVMKIARPMAIASRAMLAPCRTKIGAVNTQDDVRASTSTKELTDAAVIGRPAIVAAPELPAGSGISTASTSTAPGDGRDVVEHLLREIHQLVEHPVAAQQQHQPAGGQPGDHRQRLVLDRKDRLEKADDDA